MVAGMLCLPGLPVIAQTATPPAAPAASDSAGMTASDFLIDGVPYAKVLYLEGTVMIRPPGATSFHLLTEDEPIAAMSILYTGATGILDFATGLGMATRMEPNTVIRVAVLPQPQTEASPTAAAPESCRLGLKNGTLFSALGREDGGQIDYQVNTPLGVAGARGTMFETAVTSDNAQVSMLHGTVNFKTPDQQTSQITAGQSQQVSSMAGGKYQLGQQHALKPSNSNSFFENAGGLLDHASGYGVVRHGLGPDVSRTLQKQGYKLPANTQKRFENSAQLHYKKPVAFNNSNHTPGHNSSPKTSGNTPGSTTSNYHPGTTTGNPSGAKQTRQQEREQARRERNGNGTWNDKNKNPGQ
jgi:hypothetical protein